MAIKINFNDQRTGLTIIDSYGRIEKIELHIKERTALVNLSIYNSAADKSLDPIKVMSYRIHGAKYDTYFTSSELQKVSQNSVERGYVYLKTLNDYSAAVDV